METRPTTGQQKTQDSPRQSKGGTNLQPTPANPRQSKGGKPKRAGSQSITKRTPTQDSPRVEAHEPGRKMFLQKAKSKPATWGAVSNQLAQVDWRHARRWQARKPSNVGACNIAPGRQAKCTPTSPSLNGMLCARYT